MGTIIMRRILFLLGLLVVWRAAAVADDVPATEVTAAVVVEPAEPSGTQMAAQIESLRGSSDATALVSAVFDMARRRNVRQMALRDALSPYFVSDDDTDRFIVLLTHKVGQKRLVRDAYFRWKMQRLDVDNAYGYAEAHVALRGVSRFWLPRGTSLVLQLTLIEGRWYAKGPELINIDLL